MLVGSFVSRTIVYALLIGTLMRRMRSPCSPRADGGNTLCRDWVGGCWLSLCLMPAIAGQNLLALASAEDGACPRPKSKNRQIF